MMNYDNDVPVPEIAGLINDIFNTLHRKSMAKNQSLFVPDFPVEHVSTLNQSIISSFYSAVYTKADPVYGGAGVRIFSMGAFRSKSNESTVKDSAIAINDAAECCVGLDNKPMSTNKSRGRKPKDKQPVIAETPAEAVITCDPDDL